MISVNTLFSDQITKTKTRTLMLISEFNSVMISGLAVAVPSQKVEISTYSEAFGDEDVRKFIDMTGVHTVFRAYPEQTASDLGFEAANELMSKEIVDISDIGLLVFVTQKPDQRVPSTAFTLHKRLKLSKECSCFDLNLACSGYIYGLQVVMSMLRHSDSSIALLITGDTSVRTLSPLDRSMIMLFGDSGTATILQKTDQDNKVFISVRTDGSRFKSIITPSGAYRNLNASRESVLWGDGIVRSDYHTHMRGMDVFGFSITDVPKLIKEFMDHLGTNPDSYDCFVLHQANLFIIRQIYRKLKIPVEKIPISINGFGNNSSNSIPLVLADHYGNERKGSLKTLMCGFGAGLSWGCCDLLIDKSVIFPVKYTDNFYKD